MELAEGDEDGGGLVVAAACGFVEAEGLDGPGEGEEEQRGSDEDADIHVNEADGLEDAVASGHITVVSDADEDFALDCVGGCAQRASALPVTP